MFRDYLELPLAVRILCLGSLINRAGSFAVVFLTIYASEELGFGVSFAAACMGVYGLGSMCGAVLGGHLADRIGRRRVMLIALFGGGALLLLVGVIRDHWAFMVSVGLFSIVADMYRPAASAMIADLVTVRRRPQAFALMYISINLGFAVAPPIGGLLAQYSFQWLFLGDAASMVVYGVIVLVLIRESMPQPSSETLAGEKSDLQLAQAARSIVRDTTFVLWCLATFLIMLVFMQGLTTLPIYIRGLGYSNLQFGLLMSINGILIFLLQLPLTNWLHRFKAISVVTFGGVLIAIGFGLCSYSGGFFFLALSIVIWTVGEILQAPFKQAIVTELAPPGLRGRYLGVFTMSYAMALTVGAPAGGLILSRYGPQVLWSVGFVVAMCAVTLYVALSRSIVHRLCHDNEVDTTDAFTSAVAASTC